MYTLKFRFDGEARRSSLRELLNQSRVAEAVSAAASDEVHGDEDGLRVAKVS